MHYECIRKPLKRFNTTLHGCIRKIKSHLTPLSNLFISKENSGEFLFAVRIEFIAIDFLSFDVQYSLQ